ncbi:unnamed protein product [Rotaria sp. Silwood2]|nr:unnamed protein product [Rotaria sp. Silwood2]CAF2719838.1 unnamed protein product [Rotaria sp. Silwood2]CAF3053368.1 unnamed protein product [Rotaria sp. Silwood2]CAF3242245.1 unnamed protein product [Rotaria sp. Silwood2]CAF3910738.1 unnamed protein product [Rotaria sp. Silwood2]
MVDTHTKQITATTIITSDNNNDDNIEVAKIILKDSVPSSSFDDDHSWVNRVNPSSVNSLMFDKFPGLRHTVLTSRPASPSPPSIFELNKDYSRLVREKVKEIEKQIELFEKENAKLQLLCNLRNLAIKNKTTSW